MATKTWMACCTLSHTNCRSIRHASVRTRDVACARTSHDKGAVRVRWDAHRGRLPTAGVQRTGAKTDLEQKRTHDIGNKAGQILQDPRGMPLHDTWERETR
jgi:hypothetical protein